MTARRVPAVELLQLVELAIGCPLHRSGAQDTSNRSVNNHRRSMPTDLARSAIQDVKIFDGIIFTTPTTVCIDGGWIVDVDECSNATVKVNGTGKCPIPGLIDRHLHLQHVQSLEYLTAYGVTTAMHMNCGNYTQCHINSNQPGLADLQWAGRSTVGNGSHHAATDPTRPKDTLIYPDTDVVEFVRYQFDNGSDYHKITVELFGPSTEQQIQMVETAHLEYGKQTMTHASDVKALPPGCHLEHRYDPTCAGRWNPRRRDDPANPRQGQYVSPTINVFEFAYRSSSLEEYFAVEPGSNRSLTHPETNAQLLYKAGVPLIAGTDSVGTFTMNGISVAVPWGLLLHYELQNLVNIIGTSPAEALNAATWEAAKWHRVRNRGSIEVQKRADLVMLDSDPRVNISNTLDIHKIGVAGTEVDRISIPTNLTVPNPAYSPRTL